MRSHCDFNLCIIAKAHLKQYKFSRQAAKAQRKSIHCDLGGLA
jgi:hypothetical protein